MNMTDEEIIAMAKEAGLEVDGVFFSDTMYRAVLLRFAELVATKAFQNGYEKGIAGFNEAVGLEREACAEIADEYANQVFEHNFSKLIAHNIRARGEQA